MNTIKLLKHLLLVCTLLGFAVSPQTFAGVKLLGDTFVSINTPEKNFGNTATLDIVDSVSNGYLLFELNNAKPPGAQGVAKATLKVFVSEMKSATGSLTPHQSTTIADELTLTNSPQMAVGSTITPGQTPVQGKWMAFDVTGYVMSHSNEPSIAFALWGSIGIDIKIESKEGQKNYAPELAIVWNLPPTPAQQGKPASHATVEDMPLGSDFIAKMRPVEVITVSQQAQSTEWGFITSELQQALADYGYKSSGALTKLQENYLTVDFKYFTPALIRTLQEQQEKIQLQEKQIQELQADNQKQQFTIDALNQSALLLVQTNQQQGTDIQTLNKWVQNLNGKIKGLEVTNVNLNQNIASLSAQLTSLENRLDRLNDEMAREKK